MIDLAVVLYRTAPEMNRLITTLTSDMGTDTNWRFWLLDNSDDAGATLAQVDLKPLGSHLKHVEHQPNIGCARGNNLLQYYSEGESSASDIIGQLNPDVWLRTGHLRKIERIFGTSPEIAILGNKHRTVDGRIVGGGFVGSETGFGARMWLQPDPHDVYLRDKLPVVSVSGAAYFARRYVATTLTGCPLFQEHCLCTYGEHVVGMRLITQHYWDETYASLHARAHNFQVWYDGSVSFGHSWNASGPISGEAIHRQLVKDQHDYNAACVAHGIPHPPLMR